MEETHRGVDSPSELDTSLGGCCTFFLMWTNDPRFLAERRPLQEFVAAEMRESPTMLLRLSINLQLTKGVARFNSKKKVEQGL